MLTPPKALEYPAAPEGLRLTGPVTGDESFFSKGHTGEYLLELREAMLPTRLGAELREEQGAALLRGVRDFLERNPDFALVGSESNLIELIRRTDGYANVWLWRKKLENPRSSAAR